MRASSHNPLATLLLLVPIVTVPLLAIFGVPQIVPLVPRVLDEHNTAKHPHTAAPEFVPTAQQGWQDFREPPTASADTFDNAWTDLQSDATARALAERRAAAQRGIPASAPAARPLDLDRKPREAERTAAVVPVAHVVSDSANPPVQRAVQLGDAVGYKRPPQSAGPTASAPPARVPRNPSAAPATALTWKAAVERLNELEIRNFRLEPGQQADHFVFICSYTPQDNPRISYRFEAEADEPLRAVEKVLAQIDGWLAGR